jgi:hypothetical protein
VRRVGGYPSLASCLTSPAGRRAPLTRNLVPKLAPFSLFAPPPLLLFSTRAGASSGRRNHINDSNAVDDSLAKAGQGDTAVVDLGSELSDNPRDATKSEPSIIVEEDLPSSDGNDKLHINGGVQDEMRTGVQQTNDKLHINGSVQDDLRNGVQKTNDGRVQDELFDVKCCHFVEHFEHLEQLCNDNSKFVVKSVGALIDEQ